MGEGLRTAIESWRDEHWAEILEDIESLVKIESVEDLEAAAPNAPFGPGPRKALDQALSMAKRCGLEAHDCEGYVGYADLAGRSDTQIGIIGHVDVVPAGSGWTFDPYAVTQRDGYLIGRGVIDDKGPITIALHAVRFWAERYAARGEKPPYTVRVLFGANEETNMKDVGHYRERHEDPAFLFTPDSRFPVGYGESGICNGMLTSGPLRGGDIVELAGGQAVNAVPGVAHAVVRANAAELPQADGISLESAGEGLVRIEAQGVSAHASTPELGKNAIGLLVGYLITAGIGSAEERSFLQLERDLLESVDGSAANIACADEHFGQLSMVGGVVSFDGERMSQSFDFRYPTTTTAAEIAQGMNAAAAAAPGSSFTMKHDHEPFLMNPDSQAVRALLDAYSSVTGEEAKGVTSKGGTYARQFSVGVSFGAEKPGEPTPSWVGGMHGPDEGVSEALLKQAFTVYALALGNLMECAL